AGLPEIGSRAVAERLLNGGGVLVDGRPRAKSHKLGGGERLEFEPPAPPTSALEPQAMELAVPYEDEPLLVVDKPAGPVVHPAPRAGTRSTPTRRGRRSRISRSSSCCRGTRCYG